MPQTVAEILKASGLTDEQIAALDAKVTGAFTQVLSTASQTLEQAENAKRLQAQQYDQDIAPALDKWANDKAAMETKVAAYEAALKAAREGGFQIPEILAPAATVVPGSPTKDPRTGQFVASGTPVAADHFKKLQDDIGGAFAFVADTTWKYRSLFGNEMPDSPTVIIRESQAQRMSPADWAAKKYDFAGKEKEKRDAEQKAHDDAIRKEAKDAADREWSEKVGSNPNIRQAEVSRFTEVKNAVKEGTRPDPLKQTREQRHQSTRQAIQKELAENATVQ
jgi:hypothetical protein